ncbi:hypothetical protein SAMN04488523_12123 [Sulfitobacter brevis]|uniref:Uncharacterized protein n=1 Tax=Sulfitobacter brevis TaxID=74348 RepID=A0A1I2GAK0_9RHOB|nr:hypothetical protein SAMN04488523_12123 [Sulfitobacter brevis]
MSETQKRVRNPKKSNLTNQEQEFLVSTYETVKKIFNALDEPLPEEGGREGDPTVELLNQLVQEVAEVKAQQAQILTLLRTLAV